MSYENLSNARLDVLKEIGNIGAGNAATALSVLLHSRLGMETPIVKVLEYNDIADMVGGADMVVSAVLTRFTGEVSGLTLFILEMEEAKNMVSVMLNKVFPDDFVEFDHMDKSALKEVGNILMSSYISSISTLTGLEVKTNPPEICVDMAGAVLSMPISLLGQVGDKAFVIDSKFIDDERKIEGIILFVADDASLDSIFEALGIGC